MGISTVSGPFRSKNGFQQLDENGQWVPVAGGGGGSNNFLTINRTAANLTYTLLAPTEVGQIYNIFVPQSDWDVYPTGELTIVPTVFAGDFQAIVVGTIMVYTFGSTPVYVTGPNSSGANAVRFYASDTDYRASLQIVYTGSIGGTSYFEVVGSCINSDTLASNSRIIVLL